MAKLAAHDGWCGSASRAYCRARCSGASPLPCPGSALWCPPGRRPPSPWRSFWGLPKTTMYLPVLLLRSLIRPQPNWGWHTQVSIMSCPGIAPGGPPAPLSGPCQALRPASWRPPRSSASSHSRSSAVSSGSWGCSAPACASCGAPLNSPLSNMPSGAQEPRLAEAGWRSLPIMELCSTRVEGRRQHAVLL